MNNKEQIKNLLDYLNKNVYGKEEAIRVALLSSIAGESTFLFGLPGTAKSLISRKIAQAFGDIDNQKDYFEYLMNEFSTPDELFGPVSLKQLENDKYVRLTQNYLPCAKIAFLDEIWKSGPAVLNTLLTIVNEKIYHNGSTVQKVPLVSLTAASNELPAKDKGLEALWDRFIMRVFVNPVEKDEDFFKLIDAPYTNKEEAVNPDIQKLLLKTEDIEKWQEEIDKIRLSKISKQVISDIRKQLALLNQDDEHQGDEAYYVSDRRWKKIVHILKTSAFLNGRPFVDLMDCSLIEYAIWNTKKQHDEISEIIATVLAENQVVNSVPFEEIDSEIKDFQEKVDKTWFTEKEILGKEIVVNIDNYECYECKRKKDGNTYYITKSTIERWDEVHGIYDSNRKYYTGWNRYEKKGSTINFYNSNETFTVKKTKSRIELETKLMTLEVKKFLKKNFDEEYFNPLKDIITQKINELKEFKEKNSKPYEENLFANKAYLSVIFGKNDDLIKTLEDKLVELEKQQARYSDKANEAQEYNVGDLISKNGLVLKKEETNNITTNDMIGEICISDESGTYIVGSNVLENKSWGEVSENQKNYGKDFNNTVYENGWILPPKEQLEKLINAGKDLKINLSGKIWSGTESEGGGAWFSNAETGEFDSTTKDHTYNACYIRKIA